MRAVASTVAQANRPCTQLHMAYGCSSPPLPLPHTRASLSALTRAYSTLPPHTIIDMPALSPTMEKGNLTIWKKVR